MRAQHRNGYISDSEYEEDKKDLEDQLLKLEKEPASNWFEKMNEILDLGVELQDIIENGTVGDKKEILSRLSSNLIWNEEKLSIINAEWMNTYIRGLKKAREESPQFEPKKYGLDKRQNEPFKLAYPSLLQTLKFVRTCFI